MPTMDCERCIHNMDGYCSMYGKDIHKVPNKALCQDFKLDGFSEFDDEAIKKRKYIERAKA